MTLHYDMADSAPGCWDEAEFRRNVAQAVGYDPFRDDSVMSVAVHVTGTDKQIDGQVEWRNDAGARMGERHFVAKDGSCKKLLTELGFAVGLQIELLRPKPGSAAAAATSVEDGSSPSSATSATSPRASASPSAQRPPAKAPPTSATASSSSSDEPTASASDVRWRLWAGIGPSVAFGLAPTVTGHARLFVGARRGDLSLELGAQGTLPVVDREPDGNGFRQQLVGGSAAFCAHLQALSACLLAQASSLMVEGRGVDQPGSPAAFVAHAGARVAATYALSEIWLVTPHVDGLALLTPRRVTLNGVEVWDVPPLGLLAGIDLAARFR